jgi:hypothetical protein
MRLAGFHRRRPHPKGEAVSNEIADAFERLAQKFDDGVNWHPDFARTLREVAAELRQPAEPTLAERLRERARLYAGHGVPVCPLFDEAATALERAERIERAAEALRKDPWDNDRRDALRRAMDGEAMTDTTPHKQERIQCDSP